MADRSWSTFLAQTFCPPPSKRTPPMTDAEITLEPDAVIAKAVALADSLGGEDEDTIMRLVDALSRSTLPREGQGEVVVKPLDWGQRPGWPKKASSPVGVYAIWADKDVWIGDIWLHGKHASSLEEAKAWAQADFTSRILSALSPSPAVRDGVVEALRKALSEAEYQPGD